MSKPRTIAKRRDFLRAAKGRRWGSRAMLVQIRKRPEQDEAPARFGFTVTRKLGNAVLRNRIRRRLREAVRSLGDAGRPGHDYVLIARGGAVKAPFRSLATDVARAARLTEQGTDEPGSGKQKAGRQDAARQVTGGQVTGKQADGGPDFKDRR